MLEAINLGKSFGNQILFQHFSFQLPNQGLILLSGPSGSGKTTLLKILQLNTNFTGQLRFDGIELSTLNLQQRNEFRRYYISSVQQEVELIRHATVQDHLEIIKHLKGHFLRPHVKKSIQQFLMEVSPQQSISSLSRGQQQRFSILLSCIGQTKVLLLDEPTSGLDFLNRQSIYQLLNIMKQDQLILMSSHQALDDGMHMDGHLQLPNFNESYIQIDKKKAKLLPILSQSNWPLMWYIQFHNRQRHVQRYRRRIQLFQTFIFATMGVMISLMMLMGKEIIRITDTMIGGQYQYVKPQSQETIILESTDSSDSILSSLPLSYGLRSFYDETYFEFLKPYHRFYLEDKGFELILKDVHLGLINLAETPPVLNPPLTNVQLNNDEIILGIQIHHLRILSQTLDCFPTLNSINTVLSSTPLFVYLKIDVPEWQYRDHTVFTLKRIELTDIPQWFHSTLDYAKIIYEDRLRLPTRSIEETYEFQPWRVAKTMLIKVEDDEAFLKLWQSHELWQAYHLQKHQFLGWQIYKTHIPRNSFPRFQAHEHAFHYHSTLGYHYYPHQKLSGFAQPLFFNPASQGNLAYLETLKQFDNPYDWLDVIPPQNTSIGYILTNPGTTIKLKTDLIYEHMALDEVIVSTNLMRMWNLKIGDFIYVDHGIFPNPNQDGLIYQTHQATLKLIGTVEVDGNWLYHHPHWLTHWLMIHARIPSNLLEPEAWIFYENVMTPKGFDVVNPLKDIKDSVQDIQQIMMLILAIWFLLVGIPLLILFFYYSIQSLFSDQKNLKTLKGFGAPWSFIKHWYVSKFMLMATEVLTPTLSVIVLFDFLLKKWLGQYFYVSLSYQSPWETILFFMLFVMVFYLTLTPIHLRYLKSYFQNI
ncbi:MAG: hypothetical protein RIS53_562 [Bacillota bacterium]